MEIDSLKDQRNPVKEPVQTGFPNVHGDLWEIPLDDARMVDPPHATYDNECQKHFVIAEEIKTYRSSDNTKEYLENCTLNNTDVMQLVSAVIGQPTFNYTRLTTCSC